MDYIRSYTLLRYFIYHPTIIVPQKREINNEKNWRSGGMETIQRQSMVEIGWILVPNYSGNSFLWTVLLCVGLE